MIFFSSDHHFGHKNVIEYCKRPYGSVEEMNADLVRRWNEAVRPEDTVLYLGDFSLGKNWVKEIAPQLNGEKHLICGNHDWCHPVHYKQNQAKKEKYESLYLEAGFKTICTKGYYEICGQKFWLHHLPYAGSGDHTYEERYTEFRPIDHGHWLLCGHVHGLWKQKGKMINVGVDVWGMTPVSILEIERLFYSYTK